MFRTQTIEIDGTVVPKYSQYDDDGVPTHDANNAEVCTHTYMYKTQDTQLNVVVLLIGYALYSICMLLCQWQWLFTTQWCQLLVQHVLMWG
jgi:hypothetical protein